MVRTLSSMPAATTFSVPGGPHFHLIDGHRALCKLLAKAVERVARDIEAEQLLFPREALAMGSLGRLSGSAHFGCALPKPAKDLFY
jgi:hypothetical protein